MTLKCYKNLASPCIPFALVLMLLNSAGCERKPSDSTPGKQMNVVAEADDSMGEPVLPIDTVAGNDTVPKFEPETSRVMSEETSELIQYMQDSPDADKYAEGILMRMAYDSPDYTRRLINSNYPEFIIVDKKAMQLALFDRYGREKLRYGIACGKRYGTKRKKGDNRTSEGFFSAEGIYDSTDWLYTDDNGRTSKKKGQFGPRFIRLLIPGITSIGIHGTCAPWSIGGRVSHGCIRVKNENILELVKHVTIGMPIIVSPSDRDVKTNLSEGNVIDQVTINPKSKHNEALEKEVEKHRRENDREPDKTVTHTYPAAGDSTRQENATPPESTAAQTSPDSTANAGTPDLHQ